MSILIKRYMMRYRIKIVKFESGRVEYYPQVNVWYGWAYLYYSGKTTTIRIPQDTKEMAFKQIEDHYEGNHKVKDKNTRYVASIKAMELI